MKPIPFLLSLSFSAVLALSSAQAEVNSPIFMQVGQSYVCAMGPSKLAASDTVKVLELSGQWVKVQSEENGTYWLNTAVVVAIRPVQQQ